MKVLDGHKRRIRANREMSENLQYDNIEGLRARYIHYFVDEYEGEDGLVKEITRCGEHFHFINNESLIQFQTTP